MQAMIGEIKRPSRAIMDQYRELLKGYSPSCLICDAQQRGNVLPCDFRPVDREKVAGPALTIRLDHDNLVDCFPVLRVAQPGDVIIVGALGSRLTAMWGAMMSTASKAIGVAGAVVDGVIRDVDEIRDLGFAVWSRGSIPRASPTATHGRTDPVQVNVPLVVGDVVIQAGDIVVADENGISVVPQERAEDVVKAAKLQAAREEEIRARIASGESVAELLQRFGHL